MAEENKEIRLIDAVDGNTHDLIFKVMQKLKGIEAEVASKIESAKIDPNLYSPQLVDKFKILYYETNKSLDSVTNMIQTSLPSDTNIEQYRQENGPQLEKFADTLDTFVRQASEILNKF